MTGPDSEPLLQHAVALTQLRQLDLTDSIWTLPDSYTSLAALTHLALPWGMKMGEEIGALTNLQVRRWLAARSRLSSPVSVYCRCLGMASNGRRRPHQPSGVRPSRPDAWQVWLACVRCRCLGL